MGSSLSMDTIEPPINRENPQLRPYPSFTTLQSNGDVYNASFVTSPSDNSLFEAPNDIADHAIMDRTTTADMRRASSGATRRKQIKNKILPVGNMQLKFQNPRYATATYRWTYIHVGHIQ